MSTLRRKLASRANGKKSIGPVTEEGKRIASRNALRHGMLAASIVLDGESKDRFLDLLNSLIDELEPADSWESAMVENMAIARWRQMRVWGREKANLTPEILKQESAALPGNPPPGDPPKICPPRPRSPSALSAIAPARSISSIATKLASTGCIRDPWTASKNAAPVLSLPSPSPKKTKMKKSENFQTNLDVGLEM